MLSTNLGPVVCKGYELTTVKEGLWLSRISIRVCFSKTSLLEYVLRTKTVCNSLLTRYFLHFLSSAVILINF